MLAGIKCRQRCTTCMVALGTLVSTFCLSWMQTPQGFIIENGHLIPQDWLAIIFNPLSVSLVPYGDSRVSQ